MPDSTFNNADTDDANLQNFFSRPIKTTSFTWTPGTDIFNTFNPWTDYFENLRVINRITNFNLLRCKLKCKIVLNGNGFYFGRAIASYQPLHNLDGFTQNRQLFPVDIIAASQRPHVYLDPTNSQGGTLTLPFFWYENALRIPDMEWREMGQVNIRSIQDLKHANGSTDTITVSVFVWAEDVNLSIPTANEPGALAPQMGEIFTPQMAADEYGTGVISRPAGYLAKIAGALSSIAPIAPYAKATQLAASTVSSIAQMFGFSRPAVLADILPYRPTYLGNLSNTNMPDSTTKLTLDAKQEVTVDPRVMGLGSADEMAIQAIACRESWLTSFPWAQSDTSETLLWNSEVSPVLWGENSNELHFPACAFATVPFQHWRGTTKFRFQVVASAFHKGRLKITYDPSYPLTNEYNTNYTHVIDLAKERDFTIDIGWGQERSMIGHRNPTTDVVPYRQTAIGGDPGLSGNGIISVYVVNELTTPSSTPDNDVAVNVFVSMGDDFEVFNPDSEIIEDLVFFAPQMGETTLVPEEPELPPPSSTCTSPYVLEWITPFSLIFLTLVYAIKSAFQRRDLLSSTPFTPQMAESGSHPDEDETIAENEPMKPAASEQQGATMTDNDHTVCVYYGDPVTSFRQCLKRYSYHMSWFTETTGPTYFNLLTNNFPCYRGYAPNAIHNCDVPVYPTPYNYAKTSLINWLTPAFAARRGAMRWKYLRIGGSKDDLMYVVRTAEPGVPTQFSVNTRSPVAATADTRAREAAIGLEHMWDGAHATSVDHNPVLEVELPWYTNIRFGPAKDSSPNFPGGPLVGDNHQVCGTWDLDTTDAGGIHAFCSVGEDFTLAFFTGCPRAYFVSHTADPTTI